ncbi:MAG: hypothetical protein PHQ95_00635 [Candidatus Gracilibacteria bacterium]|nr:hypothetical protein [Candidatus Gracilibacteria bacterium]
MNTIAKIPEVLQIELENPGLYNQAESAFSEIVRLLERDNIRVQDYLNNGTNFLEEMIRVVQSFFPVNANIFHTAYSGLSKKDKETFRIANIQPLLSMPFSKNLRAKEEHFLQRFESILEKKG